ncbi:MAG: non-ribosomal peptide synthetase [Steroidobacteraceae bacterium]
MTNFAASLGTFGSAPALITAERVITYAELDRMVREAAKELGPTHRLVFLEASNTPAAIATYLGCLLGEHAVHLCGPQDDPQTAALRQIYGPNRVYGMKDGVFAQLESHDADIELHPALRVLLATSGSTGSPKLVKLSSRNIESNAASISEYLQLNTSERALTSLKFNYSYGMSIVNSHMASGGALVLTDHSVLDDEFWDVFRQHRATSLAGVPYTFEMLHRSGQRQFDTPHLRYITQAGGRLAPELVRYFAQMGLASGWRFYVMYGQTEAAPRMTYLPPEHALTHPSCIGMPIPGGRILILDAAGREIEGTDEPGELAYVGPNVMMGYATGPDDLAHDQTQDKLLTGDIACRNSAGLYYIVGRSSRFVKPFGVRVNLDDVQARVRQWAPEAVCVGVDESIVIAIPDGQRPSDVSARVDELSHAYRLPLFAFQVFELEAIPHLSNGKVNYRAIITAFDQGRERAAKIGIATPEAPRGAIATIFSGLFLQQVKTEFLQVLGIGSHEWQSIADIFSTVLTRGSVDPSDSFVRLAGDSLSYVQASLALEEYLGRVPPKWEHLTVTELEQFRTATASF